MHRRSSRGRRPRPKRLSRPAANVSQSSIVPSDAGHGQTAPMTNMTRWHNLTKTRAQRDLNTPPLRTGRAIDISDVGNLEMYKDIIHIDQNQYVTISHYMSRYGIIRYFTCGTMATGSRHSTAEAIGHAILIVRFWPGFGDMSMQRRKLPYPTPASTQY